MIEVKMTGHYNKGRLITFSFHNELIASFPGPHPGFCPLQYEKLEVICSFFYTVQNKLQSGTWKRG